MNALTTLSEWIWHASIAGTLLVALALLVATVFGKVLPVWARYALWLLVLGRLLMLVAPQSVFSVWNLGTTREGERPREPIVAAVESAIFEPPTQQIDPPPPAAQRSIPMIPLLWLTGVVGFIAVAVVRHRRLARWVRRQTLCTDPRLLALMDRARVAFGVRQKVAVICNDRFDVPAVFGAWRPRLLLPAAWTRNASDDELFPVLLHEMAHIKCRDPFLNWVCIFARSLHWFNPVIWYALRRLRRERELFCDTLVLARLLPEQRPAYGNTLIKIAAQLSAAGQPATLVPILQHKPEIHRRIHMIAKYKSTPWALSLAAGLILVALAGLTFTRAADKKTPEAPPAEAKPQKQPGTPVQILEEEVAMQQARVRELKRESAKLRGWADEIPGNTETLRKLEGLRIEAQANVQRLAALYNHLSGKSKTDLRRSITTAAPDTQLSELMMTLDRTEQKVEELSENRGAEHPEVKGARRVIKQINKQIEDRLDGILAGLKARVEAEEAHLSALELALKGATDEYRAGLDRSRPYDEALQELRTQEELLQRLRLRLILEKVDRAVEPGVR